MNAASQLPSGVFTVTSVSTTASVAANDWPVAATSPAATERAMKSRRETFAARAFSGSWLSVVILRASGLQMAIMSHCERLADSQQAQAFGRRLTYSSD